MGDIAQKIDSQIVQSRLNMIRLMLATDAKERSIRIQTAVSKLAPGSYLIGTGPSTVGIIPLSVEEVMLGRSIVPGEKSTDMIIDYDVRDMWCLSPCEVSRAHAKVMKRQTKDSEIYHIVDMSSTCGTFVNGKQVLDPEDGQILHHGDVISLGASHISTFVYCVVS